MASRSASARSAASFVMAGLRIARPTKCSAAGRLALGFLDESNHATAIVTRGIEGEIAFPRLEGARHVLLHLVEDLPLVEERGAVLRIEGECLVEGLEGGVAVPAHGHDQTQVRHGVHVLRVALE